MIEIAWRVATAVDEVSGKSILVRPLLLGYVFGCTIADIGCRTYTSSENGMRIANSMKYLACSRRDQLRIEANRTRSFRHQTRSLGQVLCYEN
jgi:hypothetical protein